MKKQKTNIILNGLIILFTLLIIFFVFMLIKETIPYVQSRREYKELQQFILPEEETVKPETIIVGNTDNFNKAESKDNTTDAAEATEKGSEEMREATCSITVDFDALWKINPDVKGWIYLEALGITYPIVKGETNDDYIYT